MGPYLNNSLYFSYILDSNYNAGNNTQTMSVVFNPTIMAITPWSTDRIALGSASLEWSNIYAKTATFSGSVILQKNN
jgi:hypothetical protein